MDKKYKKEYGCPLTKSRSNWCYGLCVKIAPYSLMSRAQKQL